MKKTKKQTWQRTNASALRGYSPLLLTGLLGLRNTLGHPTKSKPVKSSQKKAVGVKRRPLTTFLGAPDDRTSMD
jgi:hypothetical protein